MENIAHQLDQNLAKMIKNKIIFTTFIIFISGCSAGLSTQENQTYVYKKPYHYGMINKSILFDKGKYPWFIKEYNQYNPSINELNRLNYEKINIKVFMGTWCHDSKREVPRLIKILDNLKFSASKIDIVALTKDKKGYFKDYSKYKVLNTPTIIFYLDNNEIGRIIEEPKGSLESAIGLIIKG